MNSGQIFQTLKEILGRVFQISFAGFLILLILRFKGPDVRLCAVYDRGENQRTVCLKNLEFRGTGLRSILSLRFRG